MIRTLGRALGDLVLPAACAGCGRPQTRWCPDCDLAWRREVSSPRPTAPTPAPRGLPPVLASASYAGVVRAVVVAYKDGSRSHLRPLLAAPLAASLERVVVPGTLIVPAPSRRVAVRRRGEAPVTRLAEAAAASLSIWYPVRPLLAVRRTVRDQSGLTSIARSANLAGAYAVPRGWHRHVQDREVVLVDDVMTTGATLAESARAIREAGGQVRAAVVVAATRRRGVDSRRAPG